MNNRYDRQVRLFGAEGQARIRAAHVVLFGTGGNGSHVVQQLAYAGVRHWTLVEFDTADDTNLNRLVGAGPDDVGTAKIDIAKRMVLALHPDADMTLIRGGLGEPDQQDQIVEALSRATLAIGCFDLEVPRVEAVKLCSRAGVSYLDLATEIVPSDDGADPVYGGRTVFSHDGKGCLVCLGIIDPAELAREQMPAEQRAERDRLYGLNPDEVGDSGPSVVTINGVVASLACTEALMFLTELREPARQLTYLGQNSVVRKNLTVGPGDCLYCYQWRASRSERA
ncbi:hypothetical protein GCM10009554_50690 [Kribbella koreensis]|uniref:THIF-type NAD/FAD binding fold domain-containing protein n=1 Tax=Kribbella koreensis TaxID=57909 RepID=A0ABP4BJ73_9ACTN